MMNNKDENDYYYVSFLIPNSMKYHADINERPESTLAEIAVNARQDNAQHADDVTHHNHLPHQNTALFKDDHGLPQKLTRVNLDPSKPRGLIKVLINSRNDVNQNAMNRRITSISNNIIDPKNIMSVYLPSNRDVKLNYLGQAEQKVGSKIRFYSVNINEELGLLASSKMPDFQSFVPTGFHNVRF